MRFRGLRKQQDVGLPLMISLSMIMSNVFPHRLPQGSFTKQNDLDRHSSFTDLTQRSEKAFKFGLRAGNRSVFTWPDLMIARNDAVYFVSRSCRR
jgi:hypothetical protein